MPATPAPSVWWRSSLFNRKSENLPERLTGPLSRGPFLCGAAMRREGERKSPFVLKIGLTTGQKQDLWAWSSHHRHRFGDGELERCTIIERGAGGMRRAKLEGRRIERCSRSQEFGIAWKDPSGQWVKSCSILTTPNAVTATVHDRMAVMLDPDTYDLRLDSGMTNVAAASELLKPMMPRSCGAIPSAQINRVANDDQACSAPVELAPLQTRLF